MSEPAQEYTPGEMEVVEQVSTYSAFNGLVRWGSLAIGGMVLFLVVWLCAGAGFIPAAIVTVIAVGLGFAFLRRGAKAVTPRGDRAP